MAGVKNFICGIVYVKRLLVGMQGEAENQSM